MWLHSLKVAQLLRSAACLHTNQSRSYLNHLVRVAFLLQRYVEQETLLQPVLLFSSGIDINSLAVCVLEWNATILH